MFPFPLIKCRFSNPDLRDRQLFPISPLICSFLSVVHTHTLLDTHINPHTLFLEPQNKIDFSEVPKVEPDWGHWGPYTKQPVGCLRSPTRSCRHYSHYSCDVLLSAVDHCPFVRDTWAVAHSPRHESPDHRMGSAL